MRSAIALLCALAAIASVARAQVPAARGFVTDQAGVIDAPTQRRMTQLLQELKQKTGAEIAVLTVNSTAPLDDFSYAMQVADAWKIGRKGEDTGVLVLVAVQDRKVRVLTGYGVEGILPDGLIGEIQDREMVPSFRAGNYGDGVWRGVAAIAARIAAARGVELTGVPPPRRAAEPATPLPLWVIVLAVVILLLVMSRVGPSGLRGGRGPIILGGGSRGGDFPGGFGGGGGGFGGFGGGGFGGGGAGRSW